MTVPPDLVGKVARAAKFFSEFHWGDESKRVKRVKASPRPRVATKLGKLHAVTYETTKDGETALWEHEFGEEGGRQPDLVSDVDTNRLHIVGGDYDVRPEGIVD